MGTKKNKINPVTQEKSSLLFRVLNLLIFLVPLIFFIFLIAHVSSPSRQSPSLLSSLIPSAHAADKNGVSPTTISLPTGPGSIEGLGGAFQPMLNTGMATYDVDITLPDGISGHTPKLTLRYDSGLGDGPVGIGWRIGPGSITRQTEKGLPRYTDSPNGLDDDHDGYIDEPDELDRLIGYEGEELVPLGNGTYRARIEGAFILYKRLVDSWEARLKDGTLLEFGLTDAGRLSDGAQIYRWLLEKSTDTSGNVILYTYTSFPGSDHQIYLKEIRYGPGPPPWQTYYFAALTYQERPDWRKDYRSGFLIKTTKRLSRIDIGIQGASPPKCTIGDWNNDGEPDALIRCYSLSYQNSPLHCSYLSQITRHGADASTFLPPLSFSYSLFDPNTSISAKDALLGSINEPSTVMDSQLVELIDLNRDGLPDLLKTDLYGGRHTGYLNLGTHENTIRWDAPHDIASQDGLALHLALSENKVHLADMDGDGLSDLVHNDSLGQLYYFHNQGNLSWDRRKTMSTQDTSPPAPFANPQVKTADLDFDKRIDIIKSSENGYSVWFNLEEGKYSQELRTPGALHQGQVILFSDTGVHLADMNGDRLSDVVKITPTQVIYCPNRGHGFFEPSIVLPIPGQILTDSPNGHLARAELQDINGDGLSDLVIERAAPNQLWYWLNCGNDTFSPQHILTDLPSSYGYTMVTRWADINGNGTIDLIYADSSAIPRLRVLDIGALIGGSEHPNLLTGIDNGLGLITRITYKSSAEYYLNDLTPWTSTLPFPVSVVARVETTPSLDLDGIPGNDLYTKEYTYRNGYYDDLEKTFRGFAEATVIEQGDATAPTQITTHRFFTGGPDGLDNDQDGLTDEVSPEGYREDEPLKGLLRETQIRSENILYTKEETTWSIKNLLVNPQGIEVRFAYSPGKNTQLYEGTDTPETLTTTYLYDDYGNITEEKNYGALSVIGDELFTFTTYIHDTNRWILDKPQTQHKTDAAGNNVAETKSYYDGPAYTGLGPGLLEKGNLTRQEGWVKETHYVNLVRNRYDVYGNITGIMDGNGNLREIEYDQIMHRFPVRETIHIGEEKPDLIVTASYHPGFGTMTQSADFNGHTTEYAYDLFGRLVTIIEPGDSVAYPTQQYIYTMVDPNQKNVYSFDKDGNVFLTKGASLASSITIKTRVNFGEADTFNIIQYIDGMKRKLAKFEETEGGFIVQEAVLFNARGTDHYIFLPYYITSSDYHIPSLSNPKNEKYYDSPGRTVLNINPPDEFGSITKNSTQYLPLKEIVTDENGNIKTYINDGMERLIEVQEKNNNDIYTTKYAYDPLDNLVLVIDAQNNLKTTEYDGLKRKIALNDPDRGRMTYEYDPMGNLIKIIDNKGQVILYTYDAANRLKTEDYLDEAAITPDIVYHYDLPSNDYSNAFNLKGRLSWVKDLSGGEFFSYDKRGNQEWMIKRIYIDGLYNDFKIAKIFNAMNQLVRLTYPDGEFVNYNYNKRSLLSSIPGIVEKIDYTPNEKIATILYNNGIKSDYSFDPRQRLIRLKTEAIDKDNTILQYLSYRLDGVGNIKEIFDGRDLPVHSPQYASQSFQYDDLYRLIKANGIGYGSINFEYDKIGNMTLKTSPDSPDPNHIDDPYINLGIINYGGSEGCNNRGHRIPGDSPGPHAITNTENGFQYNYDDNGNMIRNSRGDIYSWDFKDRLIKVQKNGKEIVYVYDYMGQRVQKILNDGFEDTYILYINKEYEIRKGKAIKYVFVGDRRVAYIEGPMPLSNISKQQILSFTDGWNFFSLEVEPEDPNIEVILKDIKGNFTEIWSFDPISAKYKGFIPAKGINELATLHAQKGYLIKVDSPVSLTVTGSKVSNDIELVPGWNLIGCPSNTNVRISEALESIKGNYISVWLYDVQYKKWFCYLPDLPFYLNQLDTLKSGMAYWVEMKTEGNLLYLSKDEGKVFFYHTDHLGSTNVMTDKHGEVVDCMEYYPFGRLRFEEKNEIINAYGYTDKELDEESSLMYYGARYYEPVTGRFLSVDPLFINNSPTDLRNPQNLNVYAYVNNNPLKYVDPDGLWGENIHYGSDEWGGTLKWAQDNGRFTENQAKIIARACRFVDNILSGKSWMPLLGNQSYHFNTNKGTESGSSQDSRIQLSEEHLASAIGYQKEANALKLEQGGNFLSRFIRSIKINRLEKRALKELGTGLHALQDVYAHKDSFVTDKFTIPIIGIAIPGIYNHLHEGGEYADDPAYHNPQTTSYDLSDYWKTEEETKKYFNRFIEQTR